MSKTTTMSRIRKYLVRYLTRLTIWLKAKDKEKVPQIISLLPRVITDDEELKKIQPYLDELEESIYEKEITNIAVTGPYGSGKSTVIKTFLDLHPEYTHLNVSLASFKDNAENQDIDENNEKEKNSSSGKSEKQNKKDQVFDTDLERKLELSILQQIFYHVKPSKVPDSRFKRIENTKGWKLLLVSMGFVIWLIAGILLFQFGLFEKLDLTKWRIELQLDWFTAIVLLVFFTGIVRFTIYIIRLFNNSKIHKISIKGELELANNVDMSVFNKHLEEIIYFFERTKYDIVVFEDLDRFDSTDIFTKLRELNTLLNTSKQIKNNITFIYAVRDELFTDKSERVKFFDYIIPIIPFINANTAGVKLNEIIEKRGLGELLSKSQEFIQNITSFIDDIDMRLIINIFNEFCVYRENIHVELPDNLLAMIVYKNMYPSDFGKLMKREGNLYDFISSKSRYLEDIIKKIDEDIDGKASEIKTIENEKIKSEKELRAIYLSAIREQYPFVIYLLDEKLSFSDLLKEEQFEKIANNDNITSFLFRERYGLHKEEFSFYKIEELVNDEYSYNDRKEIIEQKNSKKTESLRREIEELKHQKSEIESWSLVEIFQEIDISEHLEEFDGNHMMQMLLVNGYINEHYEDYITLFHEGRITRRDEIFKKKVISGVLADFNYELSSSVNNLIQEIPTKYFKRNAILNFNLMDYLCNKKNQYPTQFQNVFHVLNNGKERSIKFIKEYIDRGENLKVFLQALSLSWPNFWNTIFEDDNVSKDEKWKYFRLLANNTEIKHIEKQNNRENIILFIETTPDFLSLSTNIEEKRIKNIISRLNIKFRRIEPPTSNQKTLFDFIYQNNYYLIERDNIKLILSEYSENFNETSFVESNYTTISHSNCEPLISYINSNLEDYIKGVFLRIEENKNEDEAILINLLNNTSLTMSIKTAIIQQQKTIINDIQRIDDREIQKVLILNNRIVISWENLYYYYIGAEEKEMDETLINYLNQSKNFMVLVTQPIKEQLNEESKEDIENFSLQLINCNELSDESYIKIVDSTPYKWNSLNFEHLSEKKVQWMVDSKFLNLTESNFQKLRENFPNKHITLVEKHQYNMLTFLETFIFEQDDIVLLLKSNKVSQSNKIELINNFNLEVIIENNKIAQAVCDVIATSPQHVSLDYEHLESLMKSTSNIDNRIKVLNKYLDILDDAQLENLVKPLGNKYQELFVQRKRPIFPRSEHLLTLLEELKNRDLISSIDKRKKNRLSVVAKYQ